MAILLSADIIFGCPLDAKSSFFGRLANRAISLLPILPIVSMPSRALRFLSIHRRNGDGIFQRVLCEGNGLKMRWVNAFPVAASVVYNKASRNISFVRPIRNPMRSPVFPPKIEGSVPVPIKIPLPLPAFGDYFKLAGPSNVFIICKPNHSNLPCIYRKDTWPAGIGQYGVE